MHDDRYDQRDDADRQQAPPEEVLTEERPALAPAQPAEGLDLRLLGIARRRRQIADHPQLLLGQRPSLGTIVISCHYQHLSSVLRAFTPFTLFPAPYLTVILADRPHSADVPDGRSPIPKGGHSPKTEP